MAARPSAIHVEQAQTQTESRVDLFQVRQEVFTAEIQSIQKAVDCSRKKLDGSGGGAGLEVIGVGWSSGGGKEDFSSVLWMTCEEDTDLWTWKC